MDLTNNSEKICQPKLLKIELKEHQKTAIFKMNDIEEKGYINSSDNLIIETNMGIIGDKVGSGKSYMVIGLICYNLITTNHLTIIDGHKNCVLKYNNNINIIKTNLIIVPYGLINQWIEYLKNSELSFIKFNKQKDFSNFKKTDNIENYNVVLLSSNFFFDFYELFNNYKWNRIFIDEIDSISIKNFEPSFFNSNFIWLITATFNNILYNKKNVAKYFCNKMNDYIFNKIIVKNNNSFIDNSIKLPNIIRKNILCKSSYELNVISKFIPNHVLEMINAGNTDEAIKVLNCNVDTNQNIIEIVTKNIKSKIYNYKMKLEYLSKIEIINQNEHNKKIQDINLELQRCENRLKNLIDKINGIDNEVCSICISEMNKPVLLNCECKSIFCFDCIISWLDKKNNCPNCRNTVSKNDINVIDNLQINKKDDEKCDIKREKIDELIHIINTKKDGRFLVFSNYYNSFNRIIQKLNESDISNSVINGSANHITNLQKKFENGKIKVLMLNAQYNGSGLNLQSATDIILFHKFNIHLEKQIIGRANRMGRKNELIVHQLLHENERY